MTVELRAELFVSVAHEMACHVMAVAGRMNDLEVGDKWMSRMRAAMSPDLRKALASHDLGPHAHGPFYGLIQMTYAQRWVTVDDMLEGLRTLPDRDLILQLAGVGELPGAREQL